MDCWAAVDSIAAVLVVADCLALSKQPAPGLPTEQALAETVQAR